MSSPVGEVLTDMAVPMYQAKADLLRVLGHPARIRVLELLAEREYAAGELLGEIAIEAGSLSQQLAVLRRAGLVAQRREGGSVVYSMIVPEVRGVLHAARSLLAALPGDAEVLADLRTPVTPATGAAMGAVTSAVVRRSLVG
jgi:DNA-binding transcriptional ArsR family regulator